MKTLVWIITEGMAGTENQCLGIADALNAEPHIIRIDLVQPWRWLSPYLGFECDFTFRPRLTPPWPDIVLTCGRKSLAAARFIKKQSGGKTFTAHIQDPRIPAKFLDLIAVPAHDQRRGANVIVTDAAPNRITLQKLAAARQTFSHLEKLPTPRIAVLIGGNSKTHLLNAAHMEGLAQSLKNLQGGLMITTSRRTGAENIAILQRALAGQKTEIYTGEGHNRYLGYLAWADMILVTEDSASMISDACTTGKPVYRIPMQGGSAKFNRFYQHLQNKGVLRVFKPDDMVPFTYQPLADSRKVADAIKSRLKNLGRPLD
jgi:mitochondrial fission protein ELM1